MKKTRCVFLAGLLIAGVLQAQHLRDWNGPAIPPPSYRMSVTPLDWKFESKTGLTDNQIEQQVRLRLLEGLGWKQRLDSEPNNQPRFPEGTVRVELEIIEAKRQKVAYRFRVVVNTPGNWPSPLQSQETGGAWHWEGGREGVSKLGDYPRHFRKDMDAVLKELVQAWKERFKK